MKQYVGLDVSQKETAMCVVDQDGKVLFEGKIPSDPGALARAIQKRAPSAERIGFETGAMASWLWHELKRVGLPVVCVDARHAHASTVRADEQERPERRPRPGRADPGRVVSRGPGEERCKPGHAGAARRPVAPGQHPARPREPGPQPAQGSRPACFPRAIGGRFRTHVLGLIEAGHVLRPIVEGLLAVHEQVETQQATLDKRVRAEARADETTRRLMSVPGVGVVTALAFRHTIDDPVAVPVGADGRGLSRPDTPAKAVGRAWTTTAGSRSGATGCCGPTCSRRPACCCTGPEAVVGPERLGAPG